MKVSASRRQFRIREHFSPTDPLAVQVMRLAILAEDMRMEVAFLHPHLPDIETPKFGRFSLEAITPTILRFWITTLDTTMDCLKKIRNQLDQGLRTDISSREAFQSFGTSLSQIIAYLEEHEEEIRFLRDKFGGHLDTKQVKQILETVPEGVDGAFWTGRNPHIQFMFARDVAYGFALQPITLKDGTILDSQKWFKNVIGRLLFPLLELCQGLVAFYVLHHMELIVGD